DVRAALAWLSREFGLPIVFAGFSFGAATGLRAACPDRNVSALISLGTPVHADDRGYSYSFLRECTKPKLFISGGRDRYAPREELNAVVASAAEPKELIMVNEADHFFDGHLPQMRAAIAQCLRKSQVMHSA